MSNRRRWQPPHPADDHALRAKPPKREPETCNWQDCDGARNYGHGDNELCWKHLEPILDTFQDLASNTLSHLRKMHDLYVEASKNAETQVATGKTKTIPRQLANGHIYLVQVGDLIKIGYTTQPYIRLRSYPPNATVHVLYPGTKTMEKSLHGQFTFALAKGREWFHDRPEIREHIAEQLSIHGEPDDIYIDRYRDARHKTEFVGAKNWTGHIRRLDR